MARINFNPAGSLTLNQLRDSNQALSSSLERLSSGRRINKAADDASGMVISHSLSSQARGLGQAVRNANDAISMAQVADGALNESTSLVNTIRTKAVQAANGSQSLESRKALQADINNALNSLNNIAQNTSFNNQKLLSGNFTNKTFQVGANSGETITASIDSTETGNLGSAELGQLSDINVLTPEGAQAAIAIADEALVQLDATRTEIGSFQNQLTSTINNLSTAEINIRSAESTIADVDYAEEAMTFSKMKLLTQAQTFAAAQANNINKQNMMKLLLG